MTTINNWTLTDKKIHLVQGPTTAWIKLEMYWKSAGHRIDIHIASKDDFDESNYNADSITGRVYKQLAPPNIVGVFPVVVFSAVTFHKRLLMNKPPFK